MAAGRFSVTDLPHAEYITLITSKTVTLIIFYAACRSISPKHSKEPSRRLIRGRNYLMEENPAAIELFIGWLYRGADALVATEESLATLLELYLMADKWCQAVVQDAVIDSTQAWFDSHPDKGLKALVLLTKKYYDLLDKTPRDRYGNLMLYNTIHLSLTEKEDSKDFCRIIASNQAFARDVAILQMAIILLASPSIIIKVGRFGQEFMVHKALLEDIPYFQEKSIECKLADPIIFELFMVLLYGQRLPSQHPVYGMRLLVKLYILCEKLGAIKHANATMDAILLFVDRNKMRGRTLTDAVVVQNKEGERLYQAKLANYVYSFMEHGSMLRRLLVCHFIFAGLQDRETKDGWRALLGQYDRKFIADIAAYSLTLLGEKISSAEEVGLIVGEKFYLSEDNTAEEI
ncbi:hypothetical protein MMC11_001210 [Xylographa trunciseda]|nr:hypothetical protein [Xylographa trunciseda]